MFPDKETKDVGGLTCKAKSFKRNIGVYKDIGGKLKIKGRRKTIREKGTRVALSNYYFLKDSLSKGASAQLIEWFYNPGTDGTINEKITRHKHYVVGAFVKLNAEAIKKVGPVSDLPLVGVVSEARVTIGKDEHIFITQKGSVPTGFAPPLSGFRRASFSVRATLKRVKGLLPPISLIRDVFELSPSQHIFQVSLRQQLHRLGPKQPAGQFDYRHAYFLMGLSDLAHRIDRSATTNMSIRGSFRTTPLESDFDAFELVEIRELNDSVLGDLLSSAQFLIAQNGHGDIVVVFRGSDLSQTDKLTKDRLLTELGITSTDYKHVPSSHNRPNKVHERMYRGYQAFEDDLEIVLRKILKNKKHMSPHVYFTGHGLGGAIATLAALDFVVKRDDLKILEYKNIAASLYSFGAPRVLSSDTFENLYRSRLAASYVVIHRDDPMPALPPIHSAKLGQYTHVDHAVVIDDNLVDMTSIIFDPDESGDADVRPISGVDFENKVSKKELPNELSPTHVRQRYHKQLKQLREILDFDEDPDDFEDDEEDLELNLTI